ncbi:uncharacterized protein CXQ87_004517 [Candidozyma duobushaemuli]|uniref:SAC domain-containing protein n=2 Tax=Candidozyma TaxID=3303203 RepID=A0ABX8I9H8_9ASCO|nr:uncharacterized protein CXQ87_004517 [[Candida] duobushaemulonis]PVH16959.1 hypothetical protein CXQ87_004517 [[Candida] duobushaemulonis]QWU89732.1 hypothetical protein CA3LBN_004080 [[Candida] haemuloni]
MSLTHFVSADGSHVLFSPTANQYLVVNSEGSTVSSSSPDVAAKGKGSTVSAVLGTIRFRINKYLVLVDKHEVTGTALGKKIARVVSHKILPLGNESLSKKDAEESSYLALLEQHLKSASLFFSLDNAYDLTNSLQRQLADGVTKPDARFFWNQYLSEELIAAGASAFVTPTIYGYFKSHTTEFKGHQKLDFALLTRRSWSRAGTRYFRRGIDEDGNVANFNETEQIFLTSDNQLFAFLQTRGSVPVYWSEINDLKYKPNLAISSRPSQDATAKHFEQQVKLYGDNYLVNLVNQSGYEKPVKDAYEEAVQTLPASLAQKVKYIYFDFHHECSKMRWDRVKLLLEHLTQLGFNNDNFFAYDLNTNTVNSVQNKVVRTNCMDCLDRTNVVQSMLGRWVLQRQLELNNYLSSAGQPWELVDPDFNLFFQSFWADNADAVSNAYSGTGALKTDYTRTGKRTKMGALQDLNNSITRYYLNNLRDGHRQDAYDLFLGNYRPFRDSINSPFVDKRSPYIQLLPYIIGASFFVLLSLLFWPTGSLLSWKNIFIVSGCLYVFLKNAYYLVKNGYQFVDWPKLVPLDFLKRIEEYSQDGKFVGVKYEEHENYKTSKKQI